MGAGLILLIGPSRLQRKVIEYKYARKAEQACAEADGASARQINGITLPKIESLRCADAKIEYACTQLRTINEEMDKKGIAHKPSDAKCAGKGE